MKQRMLGALWLVLVWGGLTAEAQTKKELTLAFGSCNRIDLPQPLWPVIAREKPDVWVWLGDNIYGDTDDMALLTMFMHYSDQREDGENEGMSNRLTWVAVPNGDDWVILHEHTSVPLNDDMGPILEP